MAFNPTQKMVKARIAAISTAWDAALNLIKSASILNDAIVELPHINENGDPVLHGANQQMIELRDTLLNSFNALVWVNVPDFDFRDYHDYLRYSFNYVGGRFVSEEDWAKNHSHLDIERERLRDKLGIR